jgi:hypothetical protein
VPSAAPEAGFTPPSPPATYSFSALFPSFRSLSHPDDRSLRASRSFFERFRSFAQFKCRGESDTPRPPVDKLPAELLGKIFGHVVFTPHGPAFTLDHCGANPYNITLVSQHWKEVAHSTPQLWVVLPGHYPQLWDRISRRSGALPLCLEWHKKTPEIRQIWPPAIIDERSYYRRLQVLKLERCNRDLKSLVLFIGSNSPIRYLHMAGGGGGFAVWNDYAEFLTLIQGLPQMTHLGLEGICIPLPTSDGTASTSQAQFHHPNLRSLYLKAKAGRISQFLEFVPLQTLERMEFEAECQNVSDIVGRSAEGVFRGFWGGRKGAPRSFTALSREGALEIVLGGCLIYGHEPEHRADASLLKFRVAEFNESIEKALEILIRDLPLADVEEIVFHNIPWDAHYARGLFQSVLQAKSIVATGSSVEFVVKALQPIEVVAPGECHPNVWTPVIRLPFTISYPQKRVLGE